jgi:hypothetical protein
VRLARAMTSFTAGATNRSGHLGSSVQLRRLRVGGF